MFRDIRIFASLLFPVLLFSTAASADPLQELLTSTGTPGISMAVVHDGIVTLRTAGVKDTATHEAVDLHTIFEAASLSKPIFAYAVLKMVDAGQLSLDTKLSEFAPDFVKDDPQAATITVKEVLDHTSGLPNLRREGMPLQTYFTPGSQFSYSGVATLWLQAVVENVSHEPLDAVIQRLVFGPLKMHDSSFIWQTAFDADFAMPHDANLISGKRFKPKNARAASTLQTTAADYALFLKAALAGEGLKPETARAWLTPQVKLVSACIECIRSGAEPLNSNVAWGFGWGLEPDNQTFFQWGDNNRFKAFVMGSVEKKVAVVILTNGFNGMSTAPKLVGQILPGPHPAFDWLGHFGYDLSK